MEFLENINQTKDDGYRLCKIKTDLKPSGLGQAHADLISDIFQAKFLARHDTNRNHEQQLYLFLSNAAKDTISRSSLNKEEIQSMSGEFTRAELDKAVKSLKHRSAFGPDGTPAKLLLKNWNIIASPLTRTFNRHLEHGILPPNYRTARLKLIPKKGDKTNIKNWRPITILNSKYKLISAAYTNRVKRVVDKIVGRA